MYVCSPFSLSPSCPCLGNCVLEHLLPPTQPPHGRDPLYGRDRSIDSHLEHAKLEVGGRKLDNVSERIEELEKSIKADRKALKKATGLQTRPPTAIQRMEAKIDQPGREFESRMSQLEFSLESKLDAHFEFVDKRSREVDDRLDKIDDNFDKPEDRFDKLDIRFDEICDRLEGPKDLCDKIDGHLGELEAGPNKLDDRFDELEQRLDKIEEMLTLRL